MTIYQIADNVHFEIFDTPVGACVSGGADSALMLYFLLKYTKHPVHIFTFANEEKFLKNPMVSIRVVDKCCELTGNYNVAHHFAYGKTQNKQNLFELPLDYLSKGIITRLYTGVTKNPPIEVSDSFNSETTENDERDPTKTRKTKFDKWYTPWTNLDKQDLFRIYNSHNLIDSLFLLTRSCEWENENKHGPDPGLGHCGKCWWCEERQWGFNSTNKLDLL